LRPIATGAINTAQAMPLAAEHFVPPSLRARRIWALIGIALFLALQVFASSGALHKSLHAEADAPGHHCVITLLSQGQVSAPVVIGIWVAFAFASIFLLPLLQSAVTSSSDLRLAPGRAPPRF